ncbi:MAG: hypothetical protein WD648_06380 [Planctomycetaceae bacterium]
MKFARIRMSARLFLAVGMLHAGSAWATAAGPIGSQAVVDLTFDDAAGDVLDRSIEGRFKNRGTLVNGVARVPSPFWQQTGKQALVLDAGKMQFVQIADSSDVDRPDAVTLGFFFLSLHELDDAAAHGIVAKRSNDAANPSANYGINFVPKSNVVQVYLNHGTGFRFPSYNLQEAFGSRRRAYLTATFERGDAPAPDEDTDADDVRVRLFANGKPLAPISVTAAVLAGSDAWITDVDAAKLLDDAPLTLGATSAQSEFSSCVIDEFALFPRALNPDEVAQLFLEVAGSNAAELAQRELQEPAATAPPRIANVSLRGLRSGDRTRLIVSGERLANKPRLVLPVANVKEAVVSSSDANRLIVDVTLPGDMLPGYYPLQVQTDQGLSNAVAIAVDRLPQLPASGSSAGNPAPLPSAFSGELSGTEQARVFFNGRAGQRVIADVDARRIGAGFDPVIEIKNERGTPLVIEWAKAHLQGDTRAELVLPEDGVYFVELHDLAYQAPPASPFRLKIGNIAIVDSSFPAVAARTASATVEPVGSGIPAGTSISIAPSTAAWKSARLLSLPPQLEPFGPSPVLQVTDDSEILEVVSADGQLQTVDARFAGAKHVPIAVNGRILTVGHQDKYLLQVTPGQSLDLSAECRSINSPLEARIMVLKHPEGNVLATSEDAPGTQDPRLTFAVPAGVDSIQVAVADYYRRGGPAFVYRLQVVPSGQPDFRITSATSQISLPENGTAIVRLDVSRAGYNGPIQLSVQGDPAVSVAPAQVATSGKTYITLKRAGGFAPDSVRRLMLIGETAGLDPSIRRAAVFTAAAERPDLPAFREEVPAVVGGPVGLTASTSSPPAVVFKGLTADVPVRVTRDAHTADRTVSLSLVSTEDARPVDPKDPKKGNKPLVGIEGGMIPPGADSAVLKIAAPLDVAEGEIAFVVRADARTHAWARHSYGTAYSEPFHLAVRDAVAVEIVPESLNLTAGGENKLRGTVKRAAGFAGPVDLALAGLPAGYTSAKITVAANAEQFELTVTAPAEKDPKDVPVNLSTAATGIGPILADRAIALKVAPKK